MNKNLYINLYCIQNFTYGFVSVYKISIIYKNFYKFKSVCKIKITYEILHIDFHPKYHI